MTLEDEAMRWLYAVSLRTSAFALDLVLGLLLTLFVVVVWRLTWAVLRRDFDRELAAPPLRSARRPDGARSPGAPSARPGPLPGARISGAERQLVSRP
jgi:hypothetical protein